MTWRTDAGHALLCLGGITFFAFLLRRLRAHLNAFSCLIRCCELRGFCIDNLSEPVNSCLNIYKYWQTRKDICNVYVVGKCARAQGGSLCRSSGLQPCVERHSVWICWRACWLYVWTDSKGDML